jgi:hypothetical protein
MMSRTKSIVRSAPICLFAICITACSSGPSAPTSGEVQAVLQEYFDLQPAASDQLGFVGTDMVCRVADHGNTCLDQDRPKLEMLVKAGLLTSVIQSLGVTAYRITPDGQRYIRPLGITGYIDSTDATGKITGYRIEEGRSVVTKIDSYTKPGVNSQGAESTTVWFTVENRAYPWVKPYVAKEARTAHLGESANGKATLVLTNKGWRIIDIGVNWPQIFS